jgi:putative heme degradation protein
VVVTSLRMYQRSGAMLLLDEGRREPGHCRRPDLRNAAARHAREGFAGPMSTGQIRSLTY